MARSVSFYINLNFSNQNRDKNEYCTESRRESNRRKPKFYTETVVGKITQFTKREHKIGITPQLKGDEITDSERTGKKLQSEKRLYGESGAGSSLLTRQTEVNEKRNRTTKKNKFHPVIYHTLPTKTKHIPQPRGILSGQTIGK